MGSARRIGVRGKRAPIALLSSVALVAALSGCSPSSLGGRPGAPENAHAELQKILAQEYRTLLDPDGLVHNPTASSRENIDFYASALLLETAQSMNITTGKIDLLRVPQAEIVRYQDTRGIPEDWMAYMLSVLAPDDLSLAAGVAPHSASPLDDDPDAAASQTWLASYYADTSKQRRDSTARSARALAAQANGGVLAAWRVLDACSRLAVKCKWVRQISLEPTIDGIEGILDARAAAELVSLGKPVTGWTPEVGRRIAAAAEEMIDATPDGEELAVANLARLVFLANGSSRAFADYLKRAATRTDPSSGLYKEHVHPVGTISNTYVAMMTLGDSFPPLVDGARTLSTVESAISGGEDVDDVTLVQALAIIARLRGLTEAEQRIAEKMQRSISGTTITAENAGSALAAVEALVELGLAPAGVSADPPKITRENEITVGNLIGFAHDGTLLNSGRILKEYSAYLADIDSLLSTTDADDPAFLTRLLLFTAVSDDIDSTHVKKIEDQLDSRLGCEGTPHMLRITSSPGSTCDLGITRLAVNSGIAMGGLGGIT